MPKESIQQMLARCPCDRCPLHDHCKRYEVACATFAWYVESSGITSDLRRIARRERGPQGQMSNPVPTREIYELIY